MKYAWKNLEKKENINIGCFWEEGEIVVFPLFLILAYIFQIFCQEENIYIIV